MSGCQWAVGAASGSVSLKQNTSHSSSSHCPPEPSALSPSSVNSKCPSVWAALVGDDVVVSSVQSDLDSVGAYGGGVWWMFFMTNGWLKELTLGLFCLIRVLFEKHVSVCLAQTLWLIMFIMLIGLFSQTTHERFHVIVFSAAVKER